MENVKDEAAEWVQWKTETMKKVYLTPSPLAKMLVKAGYISQNDPYMPEYNRFLAEAYSEHGFERTRDCLSYFISKIKGSRDSIQDRLKYFRAAMATNLERTSPEYQEELERRLNPEEYEEELEYTRKGMAETLERMHGEDQPGQCDSPETREINQARIEESVRKIEAGSESERDWLVKACIEHEEARELLAESFCGGARQAKAFLMSLCSWGSGDKERIASIYDGGDGE